jgi:hypothetical protein
MWDDHMLGDDAKQHQLVDRGEEEQGRVVEAFRGVR